MLRRVLNIVYYISFGWVLILLFAEVAALVTKQPIFSNFLGRYFFTGFTWFAIAFIGVRFVLLVAYDLFKK